MSWAWLAAALVAAAPADTGAVTLDGFTLVAFSARLADTSAAARDAMASYEASVSAVRAQLEPAGVAVIRQDTTSFELLAEGAREPFRADADSARVGYLIAAPGRRPQVRYGVADPDDLLIWISTYIHHADEPRRKRS